MNSSADPDKSEKAIRLVEYLLRLSSLRTRLIRDVSDYERVLWISDIPRQRGCFTQAWGRDEDFDSDVWIEIQNRKEPQLPSLPEECKSWVDEKTLRNKNDLPEPFEQITKDDHNPDWAEGSDQPEYIKQTLHLIDHPEVRKKLDRYIEELWLPWIEEHNSWEAVHSVYSSLFAIRQEQLRLGEEYELVLGLGLLTWISPNGQRAHRHLIVANVLLQFEARLGKFTIRPYPEGANVRPELDMLDIEEQPVRAEETAKEALVSVVDDPWEKATVEGVLKALVHSINAQGEYHDTLGTESCQATVKPVVEFAPAVILRKRSARGLTETLRRIRERIEKGEQIPSGFCDLSEIGQGDGGNFPDSPPDVNDKDAEFEGQVFFPKPSNDEQRRIVDKIRAGNGVLVQGPPGTGKSHTIANLICHLLATGKRILVTAKTPRALQVLEDLMPQELRPLCINLLGSGLEERGSLESSVGGILRKNEEWNERLAERAFTHYEQKVCQLREEKAKIDRRLRALRESETHSHTIANGAYRGTPARIAEAVNSDSAKFEWFTDAVSPEQTLPISENDLRIIVDGLRRFTPEKKRELVLFLPDTLPPTGEFEQLAANEREAAEEEARASSGADLQIANQLVRTNDEILKLAIDSLSAFQDKRRQLGISNHSWVPSAIGDIIGGNSLLWTELRRVTHDLLASIEALVSVADDTEIEAPGDIPDRSLLEDVLKLREYMASGRTLGWGPFRPKSVKGSVYLLKRARVNGRACTTLAQVETLANTLRVRIEFEKAWGFWVGRCEKVHAPYAMQLHALKSMNMLLGEVLSLETFIGTCQTALRKCPTISEPVWASEAQIASLVASSRLALAIRERNRAADEIRKIEPALTSLLKTTAHPVLNDLLQAVQGRDVDAYRLANSKLQDLQKEKSLLKQVNEQIRNLSEHMPILAQDLVQTFGQDYWETRVDQVRDAWNWSQAKSFIDDYLNKDDVPSLSIRSSQIEEEIGSLIEKLASLRGWSFCFSRLNDEHRRHMQQWKWHMDKGGKFTGKHAPYHRREAQKHLNGCREAVPAWVMPLHRVWDTVDPSPGLFDVIIVDEASQCGFEALPLFYLGEKIVIVGDDKQISPDAVGLPRNAVHLLMGEYLHDFDFNSSFDVESSLFDHGKLRFGTRRVTLREHFRCMPEIIRFSNDLCYSDTPLIPLRQFGPDRLSPLEHVYVDGGYREGANSRAVNRPEADAIANKVAELCRQAKYAGKTMGVVVLQGDAQVGAIESSLLNLLGAEEIEKRRLVCGNPYSFQGDQRDIIFLSMVAAPNERIGPLTKVADERRFNVAASRARDQMYLFHSVAPDDLSSSCLRSRLLGFFMNTGPEPAGGIIREDLERRAAQDNRSIIKAPQPFDSWFEVDVALELLRKGFHIIPQYKVAGKRIDLVVEGGNSRLAVECDGDVWHGIDHYEADMQRQRMLERQGIDWVFFRVRESAFYSNKERALERLWQLLEDRGITPGRFSGQFSSDHDLEEEPGSNHDEDMDDENDSIIEGVESIHSGNGRRADEVPSSEISDAILQALAKCPNRSCTQDSLTSRVLREVRVLTRGKPRIEFEKRVMRVLDSLERKDVIEKYRAKNKRVRLITQRSMFQ